VRAIAVEIHRLAEKPEVVKTNTCQSPLFVDIRDGTNSLKKKVNIWWFCRANVLEH
jgi:hypothetical protein